MSVLTLSYFSPIIWFFYGWVAVCEFLFLPCRGLAASSGLGSLPQCAAIVWPCGSPLPIAKLFRRAPSPFSFFLVPARLRALVSLISIVFISHRIFSSCSRLSPGTRHLFCIVHVFNRFCVFILSVALLPRVLVPPILAFLPLELFDLIALACFFPSTKQTHELIADCANTLLFLSRAVWRFASLHMPIMSTGMSAFWAHHPSDAYHKWTNVASYWIHISCSSFSHVYSV